jgi:hypothetical protein
MPSRIRGTNEPASFPIGDVLREALTVVSRQQGADGWWRSVYRGGPLHTASGLIATSLVGVPSRPRFEIEHALVEGILATQTPAGGIPAYPGGPCARATARVTELACRLFLRTYDGMLGREQRERIAAAADAVKRFAASAPVGGAFSELIANIMWNAELPDEPDLPGASLSAEAAMLLLSEPRSMIANRWLSAFARQALPAIAVLVDSNANRSLPEELGGRLLGLVGIDVDANAKRALEAQILQNQAKTGGWLWSVFGTVINLLALRELGRGANDETIERGVAFIDALRVSNGSEPLEQSWCNAEIWDTSVAGTALLCSGTEIPGLERVVEGILAEQQKDGLWAFGAGALEGDNDSSAMTLTFLARASRQVGPETRERTQAACLRCAASLLDAQQDDGGFGYSPEPYDEPYGFGRRIPFGLETALVDASTADVTGRVMAATLATTTFAPLAFEERVHEKLGRAVGFLRSSQGKTGSWPGRWTSGYLSSLAFVLPPLRVFAPELVEGHWLQRCRDFVVAHQNADEGWGETTFADSDPDRAGKGSSTPVQTAYAAIALVASSRADHSSERLEGAVRYLHGQSELGQWHNGRALYTVAFREDYFDAPFMTNAMVTSSLIYASAAAALGAERATELLVLG